MEITNIDKALFEAMILHFRNLKDRIDLLCSKYKSKESDLEKTLNDNYVKAFQN